MSAFWHDPQSRQLVAAHLTDARPAWLWETESEKLVWRNRAALAYDQAHRRQPGDTLVPISRQIPRIVRLGMPLRASRSRLQFVLGRKPVAETCVCTPLFLAGSVSALLIVMETPVSDADLAQAGDAGQSVEPFVGDADHYALVGDDGEVLLSGGTGAARLASGQTPAAELPAGTTTSRLVLFVDAEPSESGTKPSAQSETTKDDAEAALAVPTEKASTPDDTDEPVASAEPAPEEHVEQEEKRDALVDLIDQLHSRKVLYRPLDEDDDAPFPTPGTAETPEPGPSATQEEEAPDETETEQPAPPVHHRLWKVIGRGLLRHRDEDRAPVAAPATPQEPTAEDWSEPPDTGETAGDTAPEAKTPAAPQDGAAAEETETTTTSTIDLHTVPDRIADIMGATDDQIEQTSRYNFDELSRILTDRVSTNPETGRHTPDLSETSASGSLVSLGDETLILNRLPIGLLVFRDQEILFNNRAFTDLLGYVDGTSLRYAGLSGVFPPDGDQESAGPVTRLMGADGRVLGVSARLQIITWQGRPALLLSASRQKEPLNAEDLARGFAETLAGALEFGFFETSRAGILASISGRAAMLVHRSPDSLIGRPLHGLITLSEGSRLRSFLERPARFAGAERPMMRFDGAERGIEIIIFAEGMAGIVTGYFGFIRLNGADSRPEAPTRYIDPNFLIRLARAMRQPVNAIVGFAEMIRTEAFGPVGEERYADYGRFIRSAGQDITGIIDELENYARLRDEEYPLDVERISLIELLETSVARARPYASATRVLVRSAISASLPDISVDEDTLIQAVLNILASAIAHSPPGGQVVLSAQRRADGAVAVHVRDSGRTAYDDMDDNFVVFRDGQATDGEALSPLPSAIGLALTRTLLAVNACALDIDPDMGNGTLYSITIPAGLVARADSVN